MTLVNNVSKWAAVGKPKSIIISPTNKIMRILGGGGGWNGGKIPIGHCEDGGGGILSKDYRSRVSKSTNQRCKS